MWPHRDAEAAEAAKRYALKLTDFVADLLIDNHRLRQMIEPAEQQPPLPLTELIRSTLVGAGVTPTYVPLDCVSRMLARAITDRAILGGMADLLGVES